MQRNEIFKKFKNPHRNSFKIMQPVVLQKSIVLIEDKTAKREIRKVLMGSEGLICFLPVGISNSSEVLAYKPSMKIYKIIWFKSQSNQK